jgi:hypothetical protein
LPKYGWGSGSVGGVHLHHDVVGIVLVLVAGLVAMAPVGSERPVRNFCAVLFGVGAAFILDEFALVFYLRDVYWSQEGRDSIDATILGVMVASLTLVVSEPFGLDDPVTSHMGRFVFSATIAANAVFAIVSLIKGKVFTGFAAIALPPLGWVGAFRLAKPGSPWRVGSTGRTSWSGRSTACVTGLPPASKNGFSTSSAASRRPRPETMRPSLVRRALRLDQAHTHVSASVTSV